MYSYGWGVSRDEAVAMTWYRKAAEQRFAQAQRSIGEMYYLGLGVAEDDTEALKWWRKAAEQGNVSAQGRLGDFLVKGTSIAVAYYGRRARR